MTISESNFEAFSRQDKINYIEQTAPRLFTRNKKEKADLTPEELKTLYNLSQSEQAAKKATEELATEAPKVAESYFGNYKEELKKLKLTAEEEKLAKDAFSQKIIFGVKRASDKAFAQLKEGKGKLYNTILSEHVIDVLDTILDYKKYIDKKFPGLTDKILDIAAPAIVALASIYSPPLGLALKSTGIVTHAANLLKTENLENAINKMRDDLHEIDQNKNLAKLHETGEKTAELAQKTDSKAATIGKFGMAIGAINKAIEYVASSPESKSLFKEAVKYAEKNIPISEKEIDKKLQTVKEQVIKTAKQSGLPEKATQELSNSLDKAIGKAKEEMKKTLDPNVKIMDKVANMQKAANKLAQAAQNINPGFGQNKELANKISQSLSKAIEGNVKGNIEKITEKLRSSPRAKEFAKKALGAGVANQMVLKEGMAAAKSSARGF